MYGSAVPQPPFPSIDDAEFVSLNLCRSGSEWQAALEVERNSFRIRTGATPSAALSELFEPVPCDPPLPPPLPY